MRRGHDNCWLEDEHGQMIAVNLGADYVAEHEWGIEDLYRIIGIEHDENILGIERYRVKNPHMDSVLLIEENKNNAALVVVRPFDIKYLAGQKLDHIFNRNLSSYGTEELTTAWDCSTFGIRVKKPVNIKKLKRLYTAIQSKNAAVWLGGGGVFQNAGLIVGIVSAIPEASKKEIYDVHVDKQKLAIASKKTGIKEKIDALNEKHKGEFYRSYGYFALSPAWLGGNRKSIHPVQYWLNPYEQQKNNSGWYTVEELEMWIKGEGPVIKQEGVSNESATVSS